MLTADLACDALRMTIFRHSHPKSVIIHSESNIVSTRVNIRSQLHHLIGLDLPSEEDY